MQYSLFYLKMTFNPFAQSRNTIGSHFYLLDSFFSSYNEYIKLKLRPAWQASLPLLPIFFTLPSCSAAALKPTSGREAHQMVSIISSQGQMYKALEKRLDIEVKKLKTKGKKIHVATYAIEAVSEIPYGMAQPDFEVFSCWYYENDRKPLCPHLVVNIIHSLKKWNKNIIFGFITNLPICQSCGHLLDLFLYQGKKQNKIPEALKVVRGCPQFRSYAGYLSLNSANFRWAL